MGQLYGAERPVPCVTALYHRWLIFLTQLPQLLPITFEELRPIAQ